MKRIILPPSYSGGSRCELTGSDFHHLIRVSRHKTGDRFKGTDSHGIGYNITLGKITETSAILEVEKDLSKNEESVQIRLVQAIPKSKALDLVIRQSAEAGVSCVIPVFSKYSIVKLNDEKDIKNKLARWQKIVKEAVVQSGSPVITEITAPRELNDIQFEENALVLFFHQEPDGCVPLHNILNNDYKIIYILIGPEGGFAQDEVLDFSEKKYVPVYLGENVLRVETAALYAIASVKTILREKEIWRKT
jgi:16S rRNA (uracil1498-N3)-methyltransferase